VASLRHEHRRFEFEIQRRRSDLVTGHDLGDVRCHSEAGVAGAATKVERSCAGSYAAGKFGELAKVVALRMHAAGQVGLCLRTELLVTMP
jgi:hypothetical protein